MLRNVIFTLLFAGSFLPNLELIDCFLEFNVSIYRKLAVSLALGTFFLVITEMMPVSPLRITIQVIVYIIAIYIFFGLGFKRTVQSVFLLMVISFMMESIILKLLETTLMSFEQLFMIDTFYALTVMLNNTILFALAFSVKQILKQKQYRQRMKEASINVLER